MGAGDAGRIVTSDEGPAWDIEPGRPITFKLTSAETAGTVAVFEERVPVGAITPLHIHRTSDEPLHVLAGDLTLTLGSRTTPIASGTWVFVPRGTPHGWRNSGAVPAHISAMFVPADGAQFFEQLSLLGQPIRTVPPNVLTDLGQRYGYELVSLAW